MDPVVVSATSKNNDNENSSGKNSAKNAVPKINIVKMANASDKSTPKTSNGQTEVRNHETVNFVPVLLLQKVCLKLEMNMAPLVGKSYVNEVNLREQNLSSQSYESDEGN